MWLVNGFPLSYLALTGSKNGNSITFKGFYNAKCVPVESAVFSFAHRWRFDSRHALSHNKEDHIMTNTDAEHCYICGAVIPEGRQLCPNCGARMDGGADNGE